jgi:hypothetical protein
MDAYSEYPVINDNDIWYACFETGSTLSYYSLVGIMSTEDYYPIYLVKDKQ